MGAVWGLELTSPKRMVLLAMADHANDDGGRVFPSIEYVAWKTGYSERQTKRIVSGLITDGLLVKERDATRYTPNVYRIDIAAGKPKRQYKSERRVKMSSLSTGQNDMPEKVRGDISAIRGDITVSPKPSLEPSENTNTSISNEMEQHAQPPTQNYDMVSDPVDVADEMVAPTGAKNAQVGTVKENLTVGDHSQEKKTQLPKVPAKGIFPASEAVKKAFAIYCYRNEKAWGTSSTVMMRALNTISKAEGRPITVEDLRGHYAWWVATDWRGKKGEMPKPYQVSETWASYQASLDPNAPTLGLPDADGWDGIPVARAGMSLPIAVPRNEGR